MAKQKINRRAVIHTVGFSTQNLIKLYNICISSKTLNLFLKTANRCTMLKQIHKSFVSEDHNKYIKLRTEDSLRMLKQEVFKRI